MFNGLYLQLKEKNNIFLIVRKYSALKNNNFGGYY